MQTGYEGGSTAIHPALGTRVGGCWVEAGVWVAGVRASNHESTVVGTSTWKEQGETATVVHAS